MAMSSINENTSLSLYIYIYVIIYEVECTFDITRIYNKKINTK